jgi:hypothetical protein
MKCDFCGSIENVGVFATDYAPVSLSYCGKCVKIPNIRPLEIAIYGWARLGEKYFTPRDWSKLGFDDTTEYNPMVCVEGEYITVRELIEEHLTEENILKWVKTPFRLELCLQKFNER